MTHSAKVHIYGQTFSLQGELDEAYVRTLAAYLDAKMRAVSDLTPTVDTQKVAILAALAERGFRRILVEGGAHTVSRFLAARCLDRLHVMIAPIIIGAGRCSVTLPPVAKVEHALRAPIRAHVLGEELLVDCDLSAQRLPFGAAKKST